MSIVTTPERFDAIVVGGGAAGSVAAAVLANAGKRVLLLERDEVLAGRARYFDVEGYRLQWGPHLLEDPGSGITAILARFGITLEHGPTNDGMAVWNSGRWQRAGEFYESGRADLARVAREVASLDLDQLDQLDQVALADADRQPRLHRAVVVGAPGGHQPVALGEVRQHGPPVS